MEEVESAIVPIATKIPKVASEIQEAIGSIATPIQGIEEYLPRNLSIGVSQVCIGTQKNVSCPTLPFDVSTLVVSGIQSIPEPIKHEVESVLGIGLGPLQYLADQLPKIIAGIRGCLVAGSVLLLTLAVLFVCLLFRGRFCLGIVLQHIAGWSKVLLVLIYGSLCCVPLILLASLLHIFQANIGVLPPWIEADIGEVGKLCFGSLASALVLVVLTSAVPIVG